jgi:hypothetical protein
MERELTPRIRYQSRNLLVSSSWWWCRHEMKISEILQMIPTRFSFESNTLAILMLVAYLTSHCLHFAEGEGRESREREREMQPLPTFQRKSKRDGEKGRKDVGRRAKSLRGWLGSKCAQYSEDLYKI